MNQPVRAVSLTWGVVPQEVVCEQRHERMMQRRLSEAPGAHLPCSRPLSPCRSGARDNLLTTTKHTSN
jgi:hypothetical protein